MTFQFLRVGGEEFSPSTVSNSCERGADRLMFQLVEVFKVFAKARVPHRVVFFMTLMNDFSWFFALFPGPKKCGVYPPVESQSARQCQLARESDELADEPGDALDAARADSQRWRWELGRELKRRWRCSPDWRREVGSACSSGVPQLHCSGGGNGGGLGAAGGGCLLLAGGRSLSHS